MPRPRFTTGTYYEGISHQWYPADEKCHAFGVLSFGSESEAQVHFYAPAEIDEAIAELVALRADMTGDKPAPAPRCAQCGEDIESHPDPYDGDVTRWRHKSDRPSVAAFLDAEHGAGPVPMCRACENEPATEGGFCEACAPAVLLATAVAGGTPVLVDDEPEYPAIGSAIPPESNGGQSGYRVGECGHRVAGSEWRAGFRRCEHCGPDLGDDEREYCPECGADEDAGEGHADKCTIGDEAAASVTA